ncbi:kinase-like domain-containing protein [Flammula alnicola]|nr:kinase-like domain-containing protein [Flammula alnicola]
MAVCPSNRHGGEGSTSPTSPLTPTSDILRTPATPRLEIGEIEAEPFSRNFADLFDGLGLQMSAPEAQEHSIIGNPDISYDIENFTNIKEIIPDWQHHEIEEIVVMSSKRPSALSIIHEDHGESRCTIIPTAALSEFDFEFEAFDRVPTKGSIGNATACVRRDTGKKYMIKRKRATRNSPWSEQTILETLTNMALPFISWVRWSFYSGEHIYVVTDHLPEGNLMDLVNQQGPLGSYHAVSYASELAVAVSSLHAAGIVHRDLEPRNVQLDGQGHIVLTNFGRAEFMTQAAIPPQRNSSMVEFDSTMMGYRAPEILLGWAHDSAVDCWSFGMLLHYMVFGTHPFGGREGIEDDNAWLYDRIIRSSIPAESLRLVHPMARDLILKCLERNPAMRWDMGKIKSHSYFASVDWDRVSSMRMEVPSFRRQVMKVEGTNVNQTHRRHVSMNASFLDIDRQPGSHSSSSLRRVHSIKEIAIADSIQDATKALPDLFNPVPRIIDVFQEDEPLSISGTTGHPPEINCEPRSQEINIEDRQSQFWDDLDKEEQCSAASVNSLEFGKATGALYSKAPKLRKYRSAIQSRSRLFNVSTSSFQNKLRKKPRSTGALRQPRPVETIENLPIGIHQMGSGIGFTYNVPTAVHSKVSVCSFAPSCHLFHRGFSVRNLGLGLGHSSTHKTKAKPDDHYSSRAPVVNIASTETVEGHPNPRPREVGNGTFIREMYRSPSWILSPPDSLPSPLALVNLDSPATGSEPLTPATLVDPSEDEECHINITIPKNLQLELDFPYSSWAPDSTLRLVPQAAVECRLPMDSADDSLYTETIGV